MKSIAEKIIADVLVKCSKVKKSANKTFEVGMIETAQLCLQDETNLKESVKFSVGSRELGVNKNLNYDNIGELIEQIEGVQK